MTLLQMRVISRGSYSFGGRGEGGISTVWHCSGEHAPSKEVWEHASPRKLRDGF